MYLIIDFDSTLTECEALDVLSDICLKGVINREERIALIKQLTEQAMSGEIGFDEALQKRIDLLPIRQNHITDLIERLKIKLTKSVRSNLDFFRKNADRIFIVSGGFHEYINDVVRELGIASDHIYANNFLWHEEEVIGYDSENPLSKPGGKVQVLKQMKLSGDVIVVGDGYTDAEIKIHGQADRFYLYAEHIDRKHLYEYADRVIYSFDELIAPNEKLF
jgi:D-3-phosphoglycerate dehydrogenase